MGSGHGWLASDWPSTGSVLNVTAAAWTAGFHWWHSGDTTGTQNVSEYMLVLVLCLVTSVNIKTIKKKMTKSFISKYRTQFIKEILIIKYKKTMQLI